MKLMVKILQSLVVGKLISVMEEVSGRSSKKLIQNNDVAVYTKKMMNISLLAPVSPFFFPAVDAFFEKKKLFSNLKLRCTKLTNVAKKI